MSTLIYTYDNKKKCKKLSRTNKVLKIMAGKFLTVTIVGGFAKQLAKDIAAERMKRKGYCKEDIEWLMKNV